MDAGNDADEMSHLVEEVVITSQPSMALERQDSKECTMPQLPVPRPAPAPAPARPLPPVALARARPPPSSSATKPAGAAGVARPAAAANAVPAGRARQASNCTAVALLHEQLERWWPQLPQLLTAAECRFAVAAESGGL
eukprot:4125601-Prymnesium_polylepis.1